MMKCPECGRIIEAEELFRLLRELGVSKDTIEKVKNALQWKRILS